MAEALRYATTDEEPITASDPASGRVLSLFSLVLVIGGPPFMCLTERPASRCG